jgi:hypothetical protein
VQHLQEHAREPGMPSISQCVVCPRHMVNPADALPMS